MENINQKEITRRINSLLRGIDEGMIEDGEYKKPKTLKWLRKHYAHEIGGEWTEQIKNEIETEEWIKEINKQRGVKAR